MKDHTITAGVSILLAILGVAVLAVLVSNAANTSNVFGGLGDALKQMICTATSPVTGASCGGFSVTSSINFGGIVPPVGGR